MTESSRYWYGVGNYRHYEVCEDTGKLVAAGLTREQAYTMQAEHNKEIYGKTNDSST